MAIQNAYARYPGQFRVGLQTRPAAYSEITLVNFGLASGQSELCRPGDALVYNSTSNQFEIPATEIAARTAQVIVTYQIGRGVATETSGDITYAAGAQVPVMLAGVVGVRAGEALEFGDSLIFDWGNPGDHQWIKNSVDAGDVAKANEYPRLAVTVVSMAVADTETAEVRFVGVGR